MSPVSKRTEKPTAEKNREMQRLAEEDQAVASCGS